MMLNILTENESLNYVFFNQGQLIEYYIFNYYNGKILFKIKKIFHRMCYAICVDDFPTKKLFIKDK